MVAFVSVGYLDISCNRSSFSSTTDRRKLRLPPKRPRRQTARYGSLYMNASEVGRDAEFVLNSGATAGNERNGSFDWGLWKHTKKAADISLLPFAPDEVFLPGETKRLHLYEARFLALFENSIVDYEKNFAHVIFSQDRGALAAYGTLVHICSWRRLDVGVLLEIEGTARLRVSTLRRTSPFWVGSCAYVNDKSVDPESLARLRMRERTAWKTAQDVIKLCVRLGESPIRDKTDTASRTATNPKGKDTVPPGNDLAGDNGLFVLNEPAKIQAWETRLKMAAQKAAAGERFDWSSQYLSDAVAVRRANALSFAAWDLFPSKPADRQKALEGCDTLDRLESVIKGLEDQKRTLAAKQAVLDAFDKS